MDVLRNVEKMRCELATQYLKPGMNICVIPNCGRIYKLEHRKVYQCSVRNCPSHETITCGCTVFACQGCSMQICRLHAASHYAWCAQTFRQRCGYPGEMDDIDAIMEESMDPLSNVWPMHSKLCGKIIPTDNDDKGRNYCWCCESVCCLGCSVPCSSSPTHSGHPRISCGDADCSWPS